MTTRVDPPRRVDLFPLKEYYQIKPHGVVFNKVKTFGIPNVHPTHMGFGNKNIMTKIIDFIKEVRLEMVHVKWPSRRETVVLTVLVVIISCGIAYFLGLFDLIFSKGLEKLLFK